VKHPATTQAPPAAGRVFGERVPLAERYAELLVGVGVDRGLVGPHEADRIWDRHLLNCAVIASMLPPSAVVLDIGSGAGLPGLAIAIVRPDLEIVLVEPLKRRVDFLEEAVSVLELSRVRVQRARAEELGPARADVVTARAVAPLPRLARWCVPLVRPGGVLLALKGARAPAEVAAAEPELRRLGVAAWTIELVGADVLDDPTTVVRIVAGPAAIGSGERTLQKQRPDPARQGSKPVAEESAEHTPEAAMSDPVRGRR